MLTFTQRCRQFVSRLSLRTKLVAIFVILTTIPLSVVGITSYGKAYKTIEKKTIDSTTQLAAQVNQRIALTFQIGQRFSNIIENQSVINFLTIKDGGGAETYKNAKEINKLFKMYRDTFDDYQWLKGVYIIGFNGNNISEAQGVYRLQKDMIDIETIQKVLSRPEDLHIIPHKLTDYGGETKEEAVISLGRTIEIPTTNQVIGVIIVDIDQRVIEVGCEDIALGNAGYFTIISHEDGQIAAVYRSDKEAEGCTLKQASLDLIVSEESGHFIERIQGRKEFIVFNTLSQVDWKIIGRVDLQDLMKSAYTIRTMTVSVILLSIVFTAVFYHFISGRLTRPIRNLREKMKQAEAGVFPIEDESYSPDEIGDLQRGFNRMIVNIIQLIEDNKKEQELLKKAELKALQAQINPHFLYNTLDAIVWMAETNNSAKVVEITKAFSTFFRTALSEGKEWITVEEEIEHVRSYLMIQQARYQDILSYEIEVDPAVRDCRILKLILQPIVENALYHGIKNKRCLGLIQVKVSQLEDSKLLLEVIDDGYGMTEERLEALEDYWNGDYPQFVAGLGYGLKNVNERIKLYYGKEYGLTISSQHKVGTRVSLIIPRARDEEDV